MSTNSEVQTQWPMAMGCCWEMLNLAQQASSQPCRYDCPSDQSRDRCVDGSVSYERLSQGSNAQGLLKRAVHVERLVLLALLPLFPSSERPARQRETASTHGAEYPRKSHVKLKPRAVALPACGALSADECCILHSGLWGRQRMEVHVKPYIYYCEYSSGHFVPYRSPMMCYQRYFCYQSPRISVRSR